MLTNHNKGMVNLAHMDNLEHLTKIDLGLSTNLLYTRRLKSITIFYTSLTGHNMGANNS